MQDQSIADIDAVFAALPRDAERAVYVKGARQADAEQTITTAWAVEQNATDERVRSQILPGSAAGVYI
ncbi:hypothetical protein [Rhodococcus sp. SORGH_AS_0301]|uniref:hypothetical protein n=1 Tax=Rhodococcus sp. SORGH_AS_0301 TaxID=3041780 RepID=UPI0027D7C07F|nr:hypothetical protein [Rhodococcus sp. SORGH_AS_0301]